MKKYGLVVVGALLLANCVGCKKSEQASIEEETPVVTSEATTETAATPEATTSGESN